MAQNYTQNTFVIATDIVDSKSLPMTTNNQTLNTMARKKADQGLAKPVRG